MNKYLYIETKTVYGNELKYPRCKRSEILAKLCGTKTFTEKHLNLIKRLGYKVLPFVSIIDALKKEDAFKRDTVNEAFPKIKEIIYKDLIDKKIIKESDLIKAEDYVSDEEVDAPTWLKPHELEKVIKNG
tara:strand:+ start:92 stop:481 length:390 start_codon:yes stop_codon:yes gene_type:complete